MLFFIVAAKRALHGNDPVCFVFAAESLLTDDSTVESELPSELSWVECK